MALMHATFEGECAASQVAAKAGPAAAAPQHPQHRLTCPERDVAADSIVEGGGPVPVDSPLSITRAVRLAAPEKCVEVLRRGRLLVGGCCAAQEAVPPGQPVGGVVGAALGLQRVNGAVGARVAAGNVQACGLAARRVGWSGWGGVLGTARVLPSCVSFRHRQQVLPSLGTAVPLRLTYAVT